MLRAGLYAPHRVGMMRADLPRARNFLLAQDLQPGLRAGNGGDGCMLSALFLIALASAAPAAAAPVSAAPVTARVQAPATPAVTTPTAPTPLATPQFRRYGLVDGLPAAMIYAVAQDHDGYMWFATTSGLARYDGVDFEVFRHDVNSPRSLPNNQIYTLFVDRDGRLWVGGVSSGLGACRCGPGQPVAR
jgi:hypothetical protein